MTSIWIFFSLTERPIDSKLHWKYRGDKYIKNSENHSDCKSKVAAILNIYIEFLLLNWKASWLKTWSGNQVSDTGPSWPSRSYFAMKTYSWVFIRSSMLRHFLTHCSREACKMVIGKQCRPRSDAAESGVWSGSPLFANSLAIFL